jgi:hypothetical protein
MCYTRGIGAISDVSFPENTVEHPLLDPLVEVERKAGLGSVVRLGPNSPAPKSFIPDPKPMKPQTIEPSYDHAICKTSGIESLGLEMEKTMGRSSM